MKTTEEPSALPCPRSTATVLSMMAPPARPPAARPGDQVHERLVHGQDAGRGRARQLELGEVGRRCPPPPVPARRGPARPCRRRRSTLRGVDRVAQVFGQLAREAVAQVDRGRIVVGGGDARADLQRPPLVGSGLVTAMPWLSSAGTTLMASAATLPSSPGASASTGASTVAAVVDRDGRVTSSVVRKAMPAGVSTACPRRSPARTPGRRTRRPRRR